MVPLLKENDNMPLQNMADDGFHGGVNVIGTVGHALLFKPLSNFPRSDRISAFLPVLGQVLQDGKHDGGRLGICERFAVHGQYGAFQPRTEGGLLVYDIGAMLKNRF